MRTEDEQLVTCNACGAQIDPELAEYDSMGNAYCDETCLEKANMEKMGDLLKPLLGRAKENDRRFVIISTTTTSGVYGTPNQNLLWVDSSTTLMQFLYNPLVMDALAVHPITNPNDLRITDIRKLIQHLVIHERACMLDGNGGIGIIAIIDTELKKEAHFAVSEFLSYKELWDNLDCQYLTENTLSWFFKEEGFQLLTKEELPESFLQQLPEWTKNLKW